LAEVLAEANTPSFLFLGIKSALFCKLMSFWLSKPINLLVFLFGLTVLSLYKFLLNLVELYGSADSYKLIMLLFLEMSVSMFLSFDVFYVLL